MGFLPVGEASSILTSWLKFVFEFALNTPIANWFNPEVQREDGKVIYWLFVPNPLLDKFNPVDSQDDAPTRVPVYEPSPPSE